MLLLATARYWPTALWSATALVVAVSELASADLDGVREVSCLSRSHDPHDGRPCALRNLLCIQNESYSQFECGKAWNAFQIILSHFQVEDEC